MQFRDLQARDLRFYSSSKSVNLGFGQGNHLHRSSGRKLDGHFWQNPIAECASPSSLFDRETLLPFCLDISVCPCSFPSPVSLHQHLSMATMNNNSRKSRSSTQVLSMRDCEKITSQYDTEKIGRVCSRFPRPFQLCLSHQRERKRRETRWSPM